MPPFVLAYRCTKCFSCEFEVSETQTFPEREPKKHLPVSRNSKDSLEGYGICGDFVPFAVYIYDHVAT